MSLSPVWSRRHRARWPVDVPIVVASSMPSQAAVAELQQGFGRELVLPDYPDYDQRRRASNRMIDRRPVLIARCHDAADVRRAFRFARRQGLAVSVRGASYARLAEIKARWDPENVFHANQNVRPSARATAPG